MQAFSLRIRSFALHKADAEFERERCNRLLEQQSDARQQVPPLAAAGSTHAVAIRQCPMLCYCPMMQCAATPRTSFENKRCLEEKKQTLV